MASNLDKARLMSALARSKGNWGEKYDRTEHFKRFQNLKEIVKELSNKGWVIIHKKPKFVDFSLNTKYKKEIIEFIESEVSGLKGIIR